MKTKEEILSIVDATVAAYSNSPVWYKTSVLKYMQEYSDQQTKELQEQLANELKRNEFLEQTSGLQIEGKDSRIIIHELQEQLAAKEKELSEVKNKVNKHIRFRLFNLSNPNN
jgi:uncharacterized FlaG/YvyC family protein